MFDLFVQRGDQVVIGFSGGREAFLARRLAELEKRPSYKWDFSENLAGKERSDWIPGAEVAEMLRSHHHYTSTPAKDSTRRGPGVTQRFKP